MQEVFSRNRSRESNKLSMPLVFAGFSEAMQGLADPYVSLYPLTRYTTATSYAARGGSEEQIEGMFGHSIRGMSKKYVKRSVEMLRHLVDGGAQVIAIGDLQKMK
jgi:hypothetical protein